jgi:hypothetical protein
MVTFAGILHMVVQLTLPYPGYIDSMMVVINHVGVFLPGFQCSEDDAKGFRSLSIFSGILCIIVLLTHSAHILIQ